ncbi:hypothetical protein ACIOG4_27840 [Streptomyces microflavus]|uniref:hypothetical protein n=1 Tax=Streptomyces microflavus TaxID=1919 RepID=UPI00381B4960
MPDQPLPSHPSFRIRPGGTSYQVLGHGGTVIGLIEVTTDFRGRAGRDAGPLRRTALAAAEDVAHLHIALHGGPSGAQEPYTDADEAHRALAHVPLQVNDIVDSAARAHLSDALRQPHVAAIADGLATTAHEPAAITSPAGCRRTARLLHHLVLAPARSLLSEAEGEARKWMAFPIARLASLTGQARARLLATADRPPSDLLGPFPSPHAAEQHMKTVLRTGHALTASPAGTALLPLSAREPLRSATTRLPTGPCARHERDCVTAATSLHHVTNTALRAAADAGHGLHTPAHELAALATEGAERLEATARLLQDTGRLGKVNTITRDLAQAELRPENPAGHRPVLVDGHDIGPLTRTPSNEWTCPGITTPYRSPQGAATALIRTHLAAAAEAPTPATPTPVVNRAPAEEAPSPDPAWIYTLLVCESRDPSHTNCDAWFSTGEYPDGAADAAKARARRHDHARVLRHPEGFRLHQTIAFEHRPDQESDPARRTAESAGPD